MSKDESVVQMFVRHVEEDHAYLENAVVACASTMGPLDEYMDVVIATDELARAIKALRQAVDEDKERAG